MSESITSGANAQDKSHVSNQMYFQIVAGRVTPTLSNDEPGTMDINETAQKTGESVSSLAGIWLAVWGTLLDLENPMIRDFVKKIDIAIDLHWLRIGITQAAAKIREEWPLLLDETDNSAEVTDHIEAKLLAVAEDLAKFLAMVNGPAQQKPPVKYADFKPINITDGLSAQEYLDNERSGQ